MRFSILLITWLVLVGLFAAYGFASGGNVVPGDGFYWDSARREAVGCGALGTGVATAIVTGLFAVSRVRSQGLGRGIGVLLVGIAATLAAILPPFIMSRSGFYSSGDAGMAIPFVAMFTYSGGVLAFVVLSLCVLLVKRKEIQKSP